MENHAQLALSFEPRKLARSDGPETSRSAARSCRELRGEHHELILRVLLAGQRPMTACEIAAESGELDKHQCGRRVGELLAAGYVVVADENGVTDTGRRARRYVIANHNPQGRGDDNHAR